MDLNLYNKNGDLINKIYRDKMMTLMKKNERDQLKLNQNKKNLREKYMKKLQQRINRRMIEKLKQEKSCRNGNRKGKNKYN